jgi:hypothetical protein
MKRIEPKQPDAQKYDCAERTFKVLTIFKILFFIFIKSTPRKITITY